MFDLNPLPLNRIYYLVTFAVKWTDRTAVQSVFRCQLIHDHGVGGGTGLDGSKDQCTVCFALLVGHIHCSNGSIQSEPQDKGKTLHECVNDSSKRVCATAE